MPVNLIMVQLLSCIYNIISLRLYEYYFPHNLPSLAEYYLQVVHLKLYADLVLPCVPCLYQSDRFLFSDHSNIM